MVTIVILKAHESRRVILLLSYLMRFNLRYNFTLKIFYITFDQSLRCKHLLIARIRS